MKYLYPIPFLALLMLQLTACHRTPDEVLIRRAVDTSVQAAGRMDAAGVVDALTADFDGNGGAMTRQDLASLLRAAAFRGETLHAVMGPVDVEPRGERYVASFTVTLSSGGKVFPSRLGVFQVETAWRREGQDWRCYQASWTQQF